MRRFASLPVVFVAAAADLDDLFEKVEVARDEPDTGSALKSALTLQIEQMKEEAHNPFSHYARYDGKVRYAFRLVEGGLGRVIRLYMYFASGFCRSSNKVDRNLHVDGASCRARVPHESRGARVDQGRGSHWLHLLAVHASGSSATAAVRRT